MCQAFTHFFFVVETHVNEWPTLLSDKYWKHNREGKETDIFGGLLKIPVFLLTLIIFIVEVLAKINWTWLENFISCKVSGLVCC